jgi:hypothetical protein
MSDQPNVDPKKSAERVVEHNEKFMFQFKQKRKSQKSLKMQPLKIRSMEKRSVAGKKVLAN